jgi:DNA-binding NarL/FixJ family response regulator
MSVTLTSADIAHLARATQLLLSPLSFASTDEWRFEVNAQLKVLLDADTAGFHLPVPGAELFFSDDFPPDVIARFPEVDPPPLPDGTDAVERGLQLGVSTLERAYGRDVRLYHQSAFYAEYAAQTRKHDLMFAMCGLDTGEAGALACLQFFHERPTGPRFAERELALLALMLPAFRAGAHACVTAEVAGGLGSVLDGTGVAAQLHAPDGRILHRTAALQSELQADAQAQTIIDALAAAARAAQDAAGGASRRGAALSVSGEVCTRDASYGVRASLCRPSGAGERALVMVVLERRTAPRLPDNVLREAFSLTRAEVRVARLIALGRSSQEIARELHNSPHTINRHTEAVFRKLGVHKRTEVGVKLLSWRQP